MAKMTKEEKAAKAAEKKAAQKAKKEAKRLAQREKKRIRAEKKRAKREAKKAKMLAKREKERAKKAKLREKKRLAREKQKALALAKKLKAKTAAKHDNGNIDIRAVAKDMKKALAQIADEMAKYDIETRIKKAKSISSMGYCAKDANGDVVVSFVVEKSKKTKITSSSTIVEAPKKVAINDGNDINNDNEPNNEPHEVEIVPAGDLYGQNGNTSGEVANFEEDDELNSYDNEDNEDNEDDDFVADARDEQDDDLVENRREFFNSYGDDFEPNDD